MARTNGAHAPGWPTRTLPGGPLTKHLSELLARLQSCNVNNKLIHDKRSAEDVFINSSNKKRIISLYI